MNDFKGVSTGRVYSITGVGINQDRTCHFDSSTGEKIATTKRPSLSTVLDGLPSIADPVLLRLIGNEEVITGCPMYFVCSDCTRSESKS